ncbi:MAG TPA: hypothetical protein VET51_09560 [Burkholderiales bacterium]|nr:hypothetical protein [Burkholderiales bacterium]
MRDAQGDQRERRERQQVEREAQCRRRQPGSEPGFGGDFRPQAALQQHAAQRPGRGRAGEENTEQPGELRCDAGGAPAAGNLHQAGGKRRRQQRRAFGHDRAAPGHILPGAFEALAQLHQPDAEAAVGGFFRLGALLGVRAELLREELARLRVGELREQRVGLLRR